VQFKRVLVFSDDNRPWPIKMWFFYFFSSSVKHWPILIIFGM